MKYFLLSLFSLSFCCSQSQTLKLDSTINGVGITLQLPSGFDPNQLAKASFKYRWPGHVWATEVNMVRLKYDSINELKGSFISIAGPELEVEVTLDETALGGSKKTFQKKISLRKEPTFFETQNKKYVSPSGNGSDYSLSKPGNIKTLLTSALDCGTTILLKGGTYEVGSINVSLNKDCSESQRIVIMPYNNETVIFDGGDYTQYTWTKTSSDSTMYYASIGSHLAYNALCLFDSLRLYPYPFLTPPGIAPNHPSLSNLGFEQSGFYRKGNLVYIKMLDKRNPNQAKIIFSKQFTCLNINGNNFKNHIYISGITFKNYNKGQCDIDIFGNPTASYPSRTLNFTNVNNVVVSNCKFEFTNYPAAFSGNCNFNVVQNCNIKDGTGYWGHGAFKQTRDQSYLEPGSYGRYLENAGISFFPYEGQTIRGNSIRNNTIKGVVSGIVMGSNNNRYKVVESDIYNNDISWCYDGIDVISLGQNSGCQNVRIFNNTVSYCPVAFSLISPSYGPYYIFRNVVHHILQRKNHNNDVFFMDCNNKLSDQIWGTGLKLNAGSVYNPNAGHIFILHNAFHSADSLGFNMYLWGSLWKRLHSVNNIYYSEGKSNFFFDDIKNDSTYSFESRSDNYYNNKNIIATIQPVNGNSKCETYSNTIDFNNGMKTITQSKLAKILSYNLPPGFTNLAGNDFSLASNSAMINKGTTIPEFNSWYYGSEPFFGLAPDIGAIEYNESGAYKNPELLQSSFKFFPNPVSSKLNIHSNSNFSKIEIYNTLGSLIFNESFKTLKQYSLELYAPTGIYFVKVFFENGLVGMERVLKL
ncbi:MAG: T9SS type A sorting domain-containing protein [Bacteroidia bacterium]